MAGMTARIASNKLSLKDLSNNDTLWVGDTGVSRHMAKTKKGFVNVQSANSADSFTLGNGACTQTAIVGTLMGYTGRTRRIKVNDVSYCPQAKFNLFSLSLMLKRGWLLKGNKDEIILVWESNPNKIMRFNIKIITANGVLFCARIRPLEETEVAALNFEENNKWTKVVSINRLHQDLGHMGESTCREIAKHINIDVARKSMKQCEACVLAKARQKNFVNVIIVK